MTDWIQESMADLKEWCMARGIPLETKLANATAELRDAWNSSSKNPDLFYRSEEAATYMFDLTAWHSGSQQVRGWFDRVSSLIQSQLKAGDFILDYGAGIGSYSLMAASLGVHAVACEVNEKLREYIYWRACRHGLDQMVHIVSKPRDGQKYAAIVCLDTIEHLANPERFPAFARNRLVPGGYLVATWTFHQSSGMHPMHATADKLGPFLDALNKEFLETPDRGWPMYLKARS